MKIWKIILAALVIFAAGVVTGGLTVRIRLPPPFKRPVFSPENPPMRWWMQQRRDLLSRMDRELDLTPQQHQRIEAILAASQQRMHEVWQTVAPRAQEEYRRTRNRIHAELNPEQQKKFDHLFKSHPPRKPDSRHPKGPPPGTPPPE